MRVLESGGTVEQHKAAVAAATAIKFNSDPCDAGHMNGSFLSHRGLGPGLGPNPGGLPGGVVGPTSNNPSGPTAGANSAGNLKKGFSKYPPPPDDMSGMYGKGPGGEQQPQRWLALLY